MASNHFKTMDGNEAVSHVSYRLSEVISIYPITPSSPMGEHADAWAASGIPNIWGTVPTVVEMQSEGGAAGACHGSTQAGAMTTTFTASQGLLLMIPNMYKIAGELSPMVINVSARTLATHALSIFGDHSDVMACRATGWGMLASASVQEAHDMTLISHAAAMRSRIPMLHFFDGFRTSHEVSKIQMIDDEIIDGMVPESLVEEHRARSMTPDRPVLRGTAQNPDHFMQFREACNPWYDKCADIVAEVMEEFAEKTGRTYLPFQYEGAPDADKVIVIMTTGADVVHETIKYMNDKGEKVGVLKVRLYRPFDQKRFCEALPATTKKIAVLDRTKEPGAGGEPLLLDCVHALYEGLGQGWGSLTSMPVVVGGRYGLSSKDFTPAMVKGVYDNLAEDKPKNHFTVGIIDDVTMTSLPWDPEFSIEPDSVTRAIFYGLGSDGTVGANKNSIKIIGESTGNYAQGYFVYDSKKAGAVTVSHLRFGPEHIRSTYLVHDANFVACHQTSFLEKYDMLHTARHGGVFLLNSYAKPTEVWDTLPMETQEHIINKKLDFYTIDAYEVAEKAGMGRRINGVMQTAFFAISGVLPKDQAMDEIKGAIKKTYGKKGEEIVRRNITAVDMTLEHLFKVEVPAKVSSTFHISALPDLPDSAPDYVREIMDPIMAGRGDFIPVSKCSPDGTFPTATTQYEKRNIALTVPEWDPEVCIQCGKCTFVCPHASIRIKAFDEAALVDPPATFKVVDSKAFKGKKFNLSVAPEDCTGCGLCVEACPSKSKTAVGRKAINMVHQPPIRKQEGINFQYFLSLPEIDRTEIKVTQMRQQQVMRPLFEFSGSCAGCGETAYVKLMSQLFGDRLLISNATGCSSIYGGNLPNTPYCVDDEGRGPTWSNSLFEDNAEFGFGMRVAVDQHSRFARELVAKLGGTVGDELVEAILSAPQVTEKDIAEQRARIVTLKQKLQGATSKEATLIAPVVDYLVKKSVWVLGGDGWAYDIGYGGLDHVLAMGRDINVLVMDTEVYSNTGGQCSKATPRAAVAKFAEGGKPAGKKDLGLMAMTYGNVYVGKVAMGANDNHTLKTFVEAESYPGPSLIIAYSHCISHGINMVQGLAHQDVAVKTGQWPLFRYDPRLKEQGKNPFLLDSKAPSMPVADFIKSENRFRMLMKSKPEQAKALHVLAQQDVDERWKMYEMLAKGDA